MLGAEGRAAAHLEAILGGVERNEEDLAHPLLGDREVGRDVHERVEGDGDLQSRGKGQNELQASSASKNDS